MKTDHIAHISTVHRGFDIRIFHKQCKSLARNGKTVYCFGNYELKEQIEGIFLCPIPTPSQRIFRILGASWRSWKVVKQYPEIGVLHLHDPELIPMGIWAHRRGYSVIYDAHEDLPKQIFSKRWVPDFLKPIVSLIAGHFLRMSTRNFAAIVVSTEAILEGFNHRNVVAVKNYPMLSEYSSTADNVENQSKAGGFLYSGDLSYDRGLFMMLDAVSETDVKLTLAGRFQDEETERQAKQHPGWENVEFLGWLNRESLIRLQKNALAGLALLSELPNHIEAFPTKIFEYMAGGIPVIGSDFPNWKLLIEANEAGLCVAFNDVEALKSAMNILVAHPKKAQKMGENGKNVIFRKMNWKQEEKKLIKVYENIYSESKLRLEK